MSKLVGIGAVAGSSLLGVIAVLAAVHFRDSAEVPKWTPPSASLAAPMMAQLAAPAPTPAPAPPVRQVAAPLSAPIVPPSPKVVAEVIEAPPPGPAAAPPPPPAPPAGLPAMPQVPLPPTQVQVQEPPQDIDDDELSEAQRSQRQAAESNRLHNIDLLRQRRMLHPSRTPMAPQ